MIIVRRLVATVATAVLIGGLVVAPRAAANPAPGGDAPAVTGGPKLQGGRPNPTPPPVEKPGKSGSWGFRGGPDDAPRPRVADGGASVQSTFVGWSFMNRRTGRIVYGGTPGPNSTESMIKIWIAADYAWGLEMSGRRANAYEVSLLRNMIRWSDNWATEKVYRWRGGNEVIRRLIWACGLTGTRIVNGWWSLTTMTPRDAVRMAHCIASGRVTSPGWTAWILQEMRWVAGEGRFGIIDVRPVDNGTMLAIKNGWTRWWNGTWHVNCLAVADNWSLSVLTRYPAHLGLGYGDRICRNVTKQFLPQMSSADAGIVW